MNFPEIAEDVLSKLNNLDSLVAEGTLITGGHFMLKDTKPTLNPGTVQSFKSAVNLYKRSKEKGIKAGLGILINDIGMTCDTNVCYIVNVFDKDTFELPEEYQAILREAGILASEVDFYWEKHLRNRAAKMFRGAFHKDKSVKKIEKDHWLLTGKGERLLLTRNKPGGSPYGLPACPLIVAMYDFEQEKRGWLSSINFWYVGIDNQENIPNHFMVEKGLEVAKHFGAAIKVQNAYFTDEKVIANF